MARHGYYLQMFNFGGQRVSLAISDGEVQGSNPVTPRSYLFENCFSLWSK